MKMNLVALLAYAVSLATLIFQFIIPGYSDTLLYGQLVLHAGLWFAVYRLANRAVSVRKYVIGLAAVSAVTFSLAPFDIIVSDLLYQSGGRPWATIFLRFLIHGACLIVILLAISKRQNSR